METFFCAGDGRRGLEFRQEADQLHWLGLFGMCGAAEQTIPECGGLFYLDSDAGRFEGSKWQTAQVRQEGQTLHITQMADQLFCLRMTLSADPETGVIRWRTQLENRSGAPRVLYGCLPRIPLKGGDFQVYGQYCAWCAENQGGWTDWPAGNLVLANSAGRSTESCAPFACIRHRTTGAAAAIHVVPIGDWVIKFRRIAGHRTSYTVVEAGLSDASLRLSMAPGEVLELPELVLCGFTGAVESCAAPLQQYLLGRYPHRQLPQLVYNTWFFDFDVLDGQRLRQQVQVAKDLGCKTFVVDAGWFGQGLDWENQVGCWDECTEHAFGGRMRDFAAFVRQQGLGFGLWMEPERACAETRVYREHPQWFRKADAIIFDLTQDCVVEYLAAQVTRLVEAYGLCWMKMDYNTNMLRDLNGDNFYRHYLAERRFLDEVRRRNPHCSFEGCASGGLRTDFDNVMRNFHGHFVSDTVNPLEVLRMRQNTALRLLPSYMGSWVVLQETPFRIGTYTNHDRQARTKVLSAGDGWWEQTVDVSVDFALAVGLLGEWGLSGDLTSLTEPTREKIRAAAQFYEAHRAFMSRAICHPLTALGPVDDYRGWIVQQYEHLDTGGSLIFAFRLVDDTDTVLVYPQNLAARQTYRLLLDGAQTQRLTGAALIQRGIAVTCPSRYDVRILELVPEETDWMKEKETLK